MITDVHPPRSAVRDAVARALAEDLEPLGDLTASLLGIDLYGEGVFVGRDEGVLAGRLSAVETFAQLDPDVRIEFLVDDGAEVGAGERIATIAGPMASILAGERTALNLLCHLSGIATMTRRFVRSARGRCRILDTRKTTPGLRALEKAAVRAGSGFNHRASLSDGVLVKDNHLALVPMAELVHRARLRWPGREVQMECDTAAQVEEAVGLGVDRVLLDNMTPADVAACVQLVAGRCHVEVSGGIALHNIGEYAEAQPDFISIGAITHSAPILDIGLDIAAGRDNA